jgi:murein DD-endopeptidase MepM/ murein hydrolase activator NlpD
MCIFVSPNMLDMHIAYKRLISGLLCLTLLNSGALAQESLGCDTLRQVGLIAFSDSLLRVRDSLERQLLRTSLGYPHIERLVASFRPDSKYLTLLPSVLPIDVPIQAFQITSAFGPRRHPIYKKLKLHEGVDVRASSGMPVKATAAGVVSQVGHDPALGVYVQIKHAFGFETLYGHLSGYCVRPGQLVSRNEPIGKVGATGLATGPHLHYSIKKNGSTVDPYEFCFLLRRRLWLYERSKVMGTSVSEDLKCLSSKGE